MISIGLNVIYASQLSQKNRHMKDSSIIQWFIFIECDETFKSQAFLEEHTEKITPAKSHTYAQSVISHSAQNVNSSFMEKTLTQPLL